MKRVAIILGVLVLAVLIVAVAVPFFIDVNQFRPRLEAELSDALARPVKLGDLKLSILSGSVGASDLSIAEDPAFGNNPFIRAKSLKVTVDLQPLVMQRKLNVTGVELDDPEITLIQSSAGEWNFSSVGGKSQAKAADQPGSAPDLTVALIRISNGRISLRRGRDPQQVLEKLNLEVRDFAPKAEFPFTLKAAVQGGGDIALDGKVGPINAENAADTPFNATLKLGKLDLLRANFVRPATGMNGVISVNGKIVSDGRVLTVSGDTTAEQLKLAPKGTPASKAVTFDFAMKHDTRSRSGALTRGNARIGKAAATLTGTYRFQGDDTILNMKLAAPGMEVDELAAMLPALDIVLPRGSKLQGGTAVVNMTAEGPTDKLVIAGAAALKNTRLAGFDLGSRMRTIARLAGVKVSPDTDFENIGADMNMSRAGTTVQNIAVVAPGIGQLTGGGTVSPTNALDFKMRANVTASGGVLAMVGTKEAAVPFSIQGTSSEPKFIPDVKGMAAGIAQQELKNTNADEAVKAATGVINLFRRKKQE